MGYECLLAGLPDLSVQNTNPPVMDVLLEQLNEHLKPKDKPLLELLQLRDDDACITDLMDCYNDSPLECPTWWEDARETLSEADLRTQLKYQQGLHARNAFVRDWFAYNRDVNNVLVAVICRKHGLDVSKAIVGNNEVANILRKNLPDKDFGLSGIMDDYQEVMALSEENNLMMREKKTDALRFAWLEEHTRFFVFSIENVLAYFLQAQMLHRWSLLTVENGEKVFRDIVADMKKGANEILR